MKVSTRAYNNVSKKTPESLLIRILHNRRDKLPLILAWKGKEIGVYAPTHNTLFHLYSFSFTCVYTVNAFTSLFDLQTLRNSKARTAILIKEAYSV